MISRRSFMPVTLAVALTLLAEPSSLALPIQSIVDAVNQVSYTNYLANSLFTHDGNNRGLTGPDHNPARTNIYNAFVSSGLTSTLDSFSYAGGTYYNVVGTLEGYARPDLYFVVGAHYDSASNPGADDDASGVAGILEAARVLSQYQLPVSIRFIAFDAEEAGLRGSAAWSQAHSGDNILGMIELDMIAFNPAGANHDRARIFSASTSQNAATLGLFSAMTTYVAGVTPYFAGRATNSDHYPFGLRGFPAALLIEPSGNPYYHQQTDSVDTAAYIDYWYATQMTRGAVAYLAAAEADLPEPAALLSVMSGLILLAIAHRRRARFPITRN